MRERVVTVKNALGLHARAAAKLVRLALTFSSGITLTRLDTNVAAEAKDILSILNIAAGPGISLTIAADGADETEAINAIEHLFVDGFGELN